MEIEGKSFVEVAEQLAGAVRHRGAARSRSRPSCAGRAASASRCSTSTSSRPRSSASCSPIPKRGEPGRAYLAKRGVTSETADKFQLGYAPADWACAGRPPRRPSAPTSSSRSSSAWSRHRPRAGGYYDRIPRSAGLPGDRPGRRCRRVLGARGRARRAGRRRQRAAEVHQQPRERGLQEEQAAVRARPGARGDAARSKRVRARRGQLRRHHAPPGRVRRGRRAARHRADASSRSACSSG